MGNLLIVFKVGEGLFLGADFLDRVELLLSFCLFVEETCVFIPRLEPKASRFLLPIIFLLKASPMEIPAQLVLCFQREGVYREEICLDLMLSQGVLRFQSLMEGDFESFCPGFKSRFKFP
jgi:hypothetical protein